MMQQDRRRVVGMSSFECCQKLKLQYLHGTTAYSTNTTTVLYIHIVYIVYGSTVYKKIVPTSP
jgi:hypothetical protein